MNAKAFFFDAHKVLYYCPIEEAHSVFIGHAPHELQGARMVGLTTVAFNLDPGVEADYFIESFSDLLELPIFQQP